MNKPSQYALIFLFSMFTMGCGNLLKDRMVDSEILAAFASLTASLADRGDAIQEENRDLKDKIVTRIQDEVAAGNEKHFHLIRMVGEASSLTQAELQYLDGIKTILRVFAGWDQETGSLEDPKEEEQSIAFMMGNDPEANQGGGNGEAYRLKNHLEKYIQEVENWSETLLEPGRSSFLTSLEPVFTLPSEDLALVNDPVRAAMSWERLKFGNGAVVASLVTCEDLRHKILEREASQLTFLSKELGWETVGIDSLILMEVPPSTVQAAGMKFDSKNFIRVQVDSNSLKTVETNGSK